MLIRSLVVMILVFQLAPLHEGCHSGQEKRKKRDTFNDSPSPEARAYFTACLEERVGQPSVYDWSSNVDYTIVLSQWFETTKYVICARKNGYYTADCWNTEIEEYLKQDALLPIVKSCIRNYFEDFIVGPPQPRFPSRNPPFLSNTIISNPPNPALINDGYVQCVARNRSHPNINYKKLLASIQRHSVLRKCNGAFQTRPLSYSSKFQALTRLNSPLEETIEVCNERFFPGDNPSDPGINWSSWSQWSSCPAVCSGDRVQRRIRRCLYKNDYSMPVDFSVCECFYKEKYKESRFCNSPSCFFG